MYFSESLLRLCAYNSKTCLANSCNTSLSAVCLSICTKLCQIQIKNDLFLSSSDHIKHKNLQRGTNVSDLSTLSPNE